MLSLKKILLLLPFLFSLLIKSPSIAQSQDKPIKEITDSLDSNAYSKWICGAHINDLFSLFGTTDRYYSFGHELDYMKRIKAKGNLKKANQFYYNIGLNFDGYTPDHELENPDSTTTRPFAAWSYLSFSIKRINFKNYFDFRLEVGLVGPKAGGEEIQNWVHANISDDPQVRGWENQIDNQIGINLLVDYQRTIWQNRKHQVFIGSEQKIGNVFTYVWPRVKYQFSAIESKGFLPIQYARNKSASLTFETSLGLKYDFYNLTVEGEPTAYASQALDESVINRAIITAGFGARYHYKKFGIYFLNLFNTSQIKDNQYHVFGTLGFSYSWH